MSLKAVMHWWALCSFAVTRPRTTVNRLAIVAQLATGERRVVDLTSALGLAQGTVSGHLACLRGCGLVVGRPEGRQVFYSLAHAELMDLLTAAEQLLARTGDAVELCPNYGTPTDTPTDTQTSTEIEIRTDTRTDPEPGIARIREIAP